MKINLKKLSKLESAYSSLPVCQNSLQTMVDIVLQNPSSKSTGNMQIALTTLKELGVLEEDDNTLKAVQLNS